RRGAKQACAHIRSCCRGYGNGIHRTCLRDLWHSAAFAPSDKRQPAPSFPRSSERPVRYRTPANSNAETGDAPACASKSRPACGTVCQTNRAGAKNFGDRVDQNCARSVTARFKTLLLTPGFRPVLMRIVHAAAVSRKVTGLKTGVNQKWNRSARGITAPARYEQARRQCVNRFAVSRFLLDAQSRGLRAQKFCRPLRREDRRRNPSPSCERGIFQLR